MNVDLPPVIVVRQLLRQQLQRRVHFVRSIQSIYDRDWATHGGQGYDRRGRIKSLAAAYENLLTDVGVFDLERRGSADRLKLKAETTFSVKGHVLWPITFGRNTTSTDPAFTEQSLMIARIGATFSHKKAAIFEAPICFFWTRHALERLCQRENFGNNLEVQLTQSTSVIVRALSVAISFGLTKLNAELGHGSRAAWIPYKRGLIFITERATWSHKTSVQFGWRFNFIKDELSNNFLQRSRIIPIFAGTESARGAAGSSVQECSHLLGVVSWGVATFVDAAQLSTVQLSYRNSFERIMEYCKGEVENNLFMLNFDPEFTGSGINIDDKGMTEEFHQIVFQIRGLLDLPSFHVQTGSQMNHVLESDMSSSQYRSFLSARR
ncbi:hypothetical protein EQZ23_17985 [Sphingomonas sp. UV9]|uniref:hypothetical protein n=1 Tax=Sphingomonas sp. UV9 TaxID=1851410 RepID=UPI000FFC3F8D|nr:hypothetical protein [Sphingomonas sp. UV9]RXD02511.1 hypothetical protein EQZ23_17985 [Sphingomonas sp. UV9]